jgi:hypothetical protein
MSLPMTAVRTGTGTVTVATVTPRRAVLVLGWVVVLLAGIASAVGLFSAAGPGTREVTSLRGQATDLYGAGLYRFDSVLVGVGNRGADAVTLFLEVPALAVALAAYRRGSLRAAIAVIGILGWTLYYYASMSLYTAHNRLFPVYVALFAASLFALPMAFASVDAESFARSFPSRPSRSALMIYLGALAAGLTFAWAPAMLASAFSDDLPARLGPYSTEVTWALDLAVVVPAVAATAVLLHRRATLGPLAATAMLSLNVALGLALVGQGVAQLLANVPMSTGEKVGAMASFAVMTVVASVLLARLVRHLPRAGGLQARTSNPSSPDREGAPGTGSEPLRRARSAPLG